MFFVLDHSLDPLGHHATTCKRGGYVVIRHNNIRDILAESFRRAGISVQCEAGSGLRYDNRRTNILVPNWFCSTVTISRLACRLCIKTNQTMSSVISNLYGRLNMSLINRLPAVGA